VASGQLWHGSATVLFEGVEPGLSEIRVVTGGWPLPYLIDNPALSPVGSVSVVGGMLGLDRVRVGALLVDLAFYGLLAAGGVYAVRRRR
jgi:hypothetical protein